jgi:hypothetical protein
MNKNTVRKSQPKINRHSKKTDFSVEHRTWRTDHWGVEEFTTRDPRGLPIFVVELYRNGYPPLVSFYGAEWQPAVTEPDRDRTLFYARRGIHSLDFDGEVKL